MNTRFKEIQTAGMAIIETKIEWLSRAQVYRVGNLSLQDALNLYYAIQLFTRTLLTNETVLRRVCYQEGIEVHGTIWVIDQIINQNLLPHSQLCHWLDILTNPRLHRRLPKPEIIRLRRVLNCDQKKGYPNE